MGHRAGKVKPQKWERRKKMSKARKQRSFRAVAITLCMALVVWLIPGMAFAETTESSANELQDAMVADEYQIVDGQAIKMTQLDKENTPNCGTVEMQGYYRSTATYDESEVILNGNTVLTISEVGGDSSIQPYGGYTRQSTPAYGKASDYTVAQGTTKKNVTTNAIIASMTVTALFAFISPIVSAAYSTVASTIINAALAAGSKTKTAYYKETKKGHKTIPGLYHQYTIKWYLDSNYSKYVSGADSVCYDYWS